MGMYRFFATLILVFGITAWATSFASATTIGPGDQATTNNDSAADLIAIDLPNAVVLPAGTYNVADFNFQITSGDADTNVQPLLATGGVNDFTVIALGSKLVGPGISAFGSQPFGGTDTFTLASPGSVYAGIYFERVSGAANMPVGFRNNQGSAYVRYGGSTNAPAVGSPISGGAQGTFPRAYDYSITTDAAIGVVNGSFEIEDVSPFAAGVVPDGWSGLSFSGGLADGGATPGFAGPNGLAPDGDQWLYLNNGGGVTQSLGAVGDYTLVDFSFSQYEQDNINDNGSGVRISLWDGDPNAAGTLLDFAEFGATGSGLQAVRSGSLDPGQGIGDLFLTLQAITDSNNGSGTLNVALDNVAVGLTSVPEPTTWTLVALLAMYPLTRRRRK